MGVTQGAGLSLQWFRNQLAPGTDYGALTAEAEQSPAGAQGLFWLPYLMGERTPHLDATARGGWIGLTNSHRRADLIRAVIEGVSYSQRDCLDIVAGLGVPLSSVRAPAAALRVLSGASCWPMSWISAWSRWRHRKAPPMGRRCWRWPARANTVR
jgi:xylulokinase